ncbi:MAG: adaptor protein MecA [Clostridiales bacterium]|nr:adaptor protein MecA [Clostridiales bacterium]
MKIEKITDNIFRVTITLNDLEQRHIDINSIDINSPQTISLFNDLMEQVASQFGFDFSGTQLIIDPVPNLDNSFDITITKIDEEMDFESIHKYIKNRYKKSEVSVKKKAGNVFSNILVYAFKTFDDVCTLSDLICDVYAGSSSLYKHANQYYLTLSKNHIKIHDERVLECNLNEFGSKIHSPATFEGYLNEHGVLLIEEQAVERLRDLCCSVPGE